jgi:hypothetical protein
MQGNPFAVKHLARGTRHEAAIRETTYSGPFSLNLWFFNNSAARDNAVDDQYK